MGNTITEPVMPNDITQHRAVGGGVKVHRYMYMYIHVCIHEIPPLYALPLSLLRKNKIRAAMPRGKIMMLVTTPM